MNIVEKLNDMSLNFKVGAKWQDPEYLGLAYVQCMGLSREWKEMLLSAIIKQSTSQGVICSVNPAQQLIWIELIETIGIDTQGAVNSLNFEKVKKIASRFQTILNEIKGELVC